jgi:hypothetical protein
MTKYQTLSSFLVRPFGKDANVEKDQTYYTKYRQFVAKNSVKLHAITTVGHDWYYHMKIPSESKKDYFYDVVIRFFSNDMDVLRQTSLNGYYIQFYSNSPSFMYTYAYVYKQKGYLIEMLYDKLDPDYINIPPTKKNSKNEIYYDKSIYFACRFLIETKFRNLTKNGAANLKKKDASKFFRDISDFKSIKFDQDLMNEEKKLENELIKSGKNIAMKEVKNLGHIGKKSAAKAITNRGRASITVVKKKIGKPKVTSRKATTKKKY